MRQFIWLLVPALMVLCGARGLHAQDTRSLIIQDGQVSINGKTLPAQGVPRELDLEGLSVVFNFAGEGNPVIQLNGGRFEILPDALRYLGQEEAFAADGRLQPMSGSAFLQEPGPGIEAGQQPVSAAERQQALNEHFLAGVRERDRRLYALLLREAHLEEETYRLAARIRQTDDEALRDSLATLLNDRLGEAFELKQENRREEINQVEQQLEGLKRSLGERERRRETIIDARYRELTGAPPRRR